MLVCPAIMRIVKDDGTAFVSVLDMTSKFDLCDETKEMKLSRNY
jgi:hypothetical protein